MIILDLPVKFILIHQKSLNPDGDNYALGVQAEE